MAAGSVYTTLQRLAPGKIARTALAAAVFRETPLDIGGHTGVQATIIRLDDVNLPTHWLQR